MNLGLWRVWKKMPEVQLLAQTYDSITFQFPDENNSSKEAGVISKALALIRVELKANSGRSYTVPGEAKVGWNWGAEVTAEDRFASALAGKKQQRLNVEGLRKWSPSVPDKRARPTGLKRITL
jgi:hypothetical protein